MGPQEKIMIREADLGPVIARADHQDGAIEVNSAIFYKLPPMVQEFVLCHEVCHLQYGERDEDRTNALATQLFLSRATGAGDRARREKFVSYMDGRDYSNFAWEMLIAPVVSLGMTVYGIIQNSNAGWYSWSTAVQRANLNTMLATAFEQSRRQSQQSAAELFWEQMMPYTNKDNSLDDFLNRSKNSWVKSVIREYENKYGFGFREVTPIDPTAFPIAMLAVGLLVGAAVYLIIKKFRK